MERKICSTYFRGTPQFKSHFCFTAILLNVVFCNKFCMKVFFSVFLLFVTQDCSHKQHRAKRFLSWMSVFNARWNDDGGNGRLFQHAISSPLFPLSTYSNPSAFLSQSNLCKPSTPFIYGVFSDEKNYYFVQKRARSFDRITFF